MRKWWAGAAAVVFLFPCAVSVHAVDLLAGSILSKSRSVSGMILGGPVILNADTLTYEEIPGVAIAEGNVEIEFGNRTIRADRIRYDTNTGEAELSGHVHYKDAGDEFSFDRIVLNIETELGVLYNGTIRISANNLQISSERFEKTGEQTYRVHKGSLTTCPCDPEPDWKIDVRRSEVTLDRYAVGKDVTFKVRGVPVMWLPWAAFPVKSSRQSGFLTPSYSRDGSKGYSLQLPYYWAISRWSDSTLTLEEMSKRGLRTEAEYRFSLNPSSIGEARATFHHDKKTGEDRYRLYGNNTYMNSDGWTANARWDYASDDLYYVDMVEADILRTARHVPSRGFVGKGSGENYVAMSAVWVKDLQIVPEDNTVQRLPEVSATLLPRSVGIGGIEMGGEMHGTYFYRTAGDRELRARSYAEMYRTIPLIPAVTFTPYLFLDLLGSIPASGTNGNQSESRVLPGCGANVQADLRRTYLTGEGKRLVHLVQSDVTFRFVPEVDQKGIPLTDQWARVGEQQQFTFAVTQRIIRVDNVTGPYELASLALEWALDLGNKKPTGSPYLDPLSPFVRSLRDQIDIAAGRIARKQDAASDLFARFQFHPSPQWILGGETLLDTVNGKLTMGALRTEWKRSPENRALFEYRVSRDLSEDIHGQFAVRPMRFLGLLANVNYSIKTGQLTEGTGMFRLYPKSECWNIGLRVSRKTNPNDTSYHLLFSLNGIGTQGESEREALWQ